MITIGIVAFVISILSLVVIRYFAGIFVWITILVFILALFGLAYYSRKEYERLDAIAADENL